MPWDQPTRTLLALTILAAIIFFVVGFATVPVAAPAAAPKLTTVSTPLQPAKK